MKNNSSEYLSTTRSSIHGVIQQKAFDIVANTSIIDVQSVAYVSGTAGGSCAAKNLHIHRRAVTPL